MIVSTNEQRCRENNSRLENEGEGPIYEIPTERPANLPKTYDLPSRVGIDNILKIRKGVFCIIRFNDLSRNLIKGQIVKIIDITLNKNNSVKSIKVKNIENNEDLTLVKVEIPTDFKVYDKKNNSEVYLTVIQFPITLSYSLTAHSTQGKTLDCNIGIDLKDKYKNNQNNNIIINSYFVALTRVHDSKQIFMNHHPASLLYYEMEIKSIKDIYKMRKNFTNNDSSLFFKKIKTFKRKNIFNINNNDDDDDDDDENLISSRDLQDVNDIISKKICRRR